MSSPEGRRTRMRRRWRIVVFLFVILATGVTNESSVKAQRLVEQIEDSPIRTHPYHEPQPHPTSTPERGPTVQEVCNLYRMSVKTDYLFTLDDERDGLGGAYSLNGRPRFDPVRVDTTNLQCLSVMFEKAREETDEKQKKFIAEYAANNSHRDPLIWTKMWDDQFVRQLMYHTSNKLFDIYDDCAPEERHNIADPQAGWENQTAHKWLNSKCTSVVTYFNKDCVRVQDPQVTRLCGETEMMLYISTPLSLEWDSDERVGDTVSIVSFPVNPVEAGARWIWKASGKLPLLVYDPSHEGKITSATQLFGNWTFGGQSVAALSPSAQFNSAKPWRNGYEALGSLDSDRDGMVSGEELEPLGLWFDHNRDGVSQPGEVRAARDSGLVELMYRNFASNPITRDLDLQVGFTRIHSDGRRIPGRSVDWSSDRAHNPSELFMRHMGGLLEARGEKTNQVQISTLQEVAPQSPPAALPASSLRAEITGVWDWSFDDEDLNRGKQVGVLILAEDKAGRLMGRSLIEAPLASNVGLSSVVVATYFGGSRASDGSINFELNSPAGRISTTAGLDSESGLLRGFSLFNSSDASRKIQYRWVAKRRVISRDR